MWNFSGSTYLIIDTGIGRIIAPPLISEVIDVVPNENGIVNEILVEGNGEMRIVLATHWEPSDSAYSFGFGGKMGKNLTVITGAWEIIVSIFVLQ